MFLHPKDIQLAQIFLRAECLQDVSKISNTDSSIFSSKIETSHLSNEPDDVKYSSHPKQSLGKAKPELQAGLKKVNCGVVIPTLRRQNTLTQLLESWKAPGDSKANILDDQHPPSDSEEPDDSGYISK